MISPTSYSLYHRCARAWWYRYVARVPTPQTPALARGSAVHAAIEEYLVHGRWPESDAIDVVQARRAQGTLDSWWADHSPGEIERSISLSLEPWGGVDVLGGRVDWSGRTPGPWVVDHKTTANPAYWLTPERAAADTQLLAYAGALFGPGVDVVVGHHYVPPPPHEPAIVTGLATAAAIDDVLRRYAETTVAVEQVRSAPTADHVVPTPSGCWAYGGCSYADRCTAAPSSLRARFQPIAQEVTVNQSTLRERLGLPPDRKSVV